MKSEAQIKGQAARISEGESAAILFSAGKDGIAAADLWLQYTSIKPRFVYFYFVDGLSFVERILKHYEKRWNIRIDRRPCHATMSLISKAEGGKKYSFGDVERLYREEFEVDWVISGMKAADSLARRGMFKGIAEGIDEDKRRLCPIVDWTEKQVATYCRVRKLPLPITYNYGMKRSVWIPDAEMLLWIKGHFPRDYRLIIDTFPQLELAAEKRFRGYR